MAFPIIDEITAKRMVFAFTWQFLPLSKGRYNLFKLVYVLTALLSEF